MLAAPRAAADLPSANAVSPASSRPGEEATHPHPSDERSRLEARLDFLTSRIETQRRHAEWWWTGFLNVYAAGLAVQTTRAASRGRGFFLYPGRNAAERADLIYSAVKAAGGVVRFAVQPYGGIEGTSSFVHLPEGTAREMQTKVAQAEHVLAQNADATTPFGPWYAHLLNVLINGAGVLITGLGYDDWQTGTVSAGVGIMMGELSFVTQPWEADDDLEAYEARFDGERRPSEPNEATIRFAPHGAGLGLTGSF